MLTFSIINLAIDVLNIFCFAKAKQLLGYATVEPKITPDRRGAKESWTSTQQMEESMTKEVRHIQGERYDEDDTIKEGFAHSHHDGTNLNMCSAYTHVFADTLRSLAIILAAGIALTVHSVKPEVADASAAVVVSGLILVSLVPLVRGLTRTASELCAIAAEVRQLTRKVDLLQSSRTTTVVDMG
jgi:Co/Zn/Cd efflux system component